MTRITLTRYEFEHNLLPARCVQCGTAADQRLPRPLPATPRVRTALWLIPVSFLLYLCVPGLALYMHRFFPYISVGLPVCNLHLDHGRWRDRVRSQYLRPCFFAASVAVEVAFVAAGLVFHPAVSLLFAHAAAFVVLVALVVDHVAIGRGEVFVSRDGRYGVQLARVHPAFIAAVIEERARDRVANPDRRPGPQGIHADYDDEPS
jgi:hypothetical protein